MGTGKDYFSVAENDYLFFEFDIKHGRVGNPLCSASQNICEKYLKHIVDRYCNADIDLTSVLKTHTLRVMQKFIQQYIPDFRCNWEVVLKADGYYFNTRYPGDDYFDVDQEDVDNCWAAVNEVRNAVLNFMAEQDNKEKEENTT